LSGYFDEFPNGVSVEPIPPPNINDAIYMPEKITKKHPVNARGQPITSNY
jgi:hypothetical protein